MTAATDPDSAAAVIRPIAPGDRDAWQVLFSAYGVFYETDFPSHVLDGVWRWLMDADHELSAFVAVVDGRLVGFAHLRRVADTFTAGPGWFLDDLYVVPGRRGGGIAGALIEACVTSAHEAGGGTLRWITAADNVTAQRLYDRVATRADWVTYEKET